MSVHRFQIAAIATWCVALVVVLGLLFSLGISLSAGQIVTLLLAGCMPVLVLLAVFRGAPHTIGQLLYETENAPANLNEDAKRDL